MRDVTSDAQRQIFGTLGSVSLNDIIQLLGMAKRTATLELRRGHQRGQLFFRNGQIIHAIADRYEGEESFIELLGWADAEFSIEEGIDALPKISITKSTEALLLSTMTTLDEVARVRGQPAVSVAPSITKKRLPPRPKSHPKSTRRGWPAVGLAIFACTFVGALAALAVVGSETANGWQRLPAVASPASPTVAPAVPAPPDAWSVAAAVWARPIERVVESPPPPPPERVEPAPAPALVTRPGHLTVVVEPWARVEIDGRAVGQTPLGKLALAPGLHVIALRNDHVVGMIRDEVVIESDASVVRRYSFNDVGYLTLVVTPWADVSVDGRSIGQTPLGKVAVPAGTHSVRFTHPELGETTRDVTISTGSTVLVRVELAEGRR